jgi:hypothetical protein
MAEAQVPDPCRGGYQYEEIAGYGLNARALCRPLDRIVGSWCEGVQARGIVDFERTNKGLILVASSWPKSSPKPTH